MTELSCYMALCGMDTAHKFLAFKNAMNNNYKMQNFITAAHFARLVLDLEPTGVIKMYFNNCYRYLLINLKLSPSSKSITKHSNRREPMPRN